MSAAVLTPVRVVLIDDSPIIRLGLKSALEDYPAIVIVGEAGNATEGLKIVTTQRPDVVLLDLHLPDKSGLEVCRAIRENLNRVRVLILTSDGNPRHVQSALEAGASGYLLKENDGATLAAGLRQAAEGGTVMDASFAANLGNGGRPATPPVQNAAAARLALLSHQEGRVVALLAEGLTNKEIGHQLGLTEKTVKNYLAAIFTKLDIERRTQAAALYVAAHQP